MNAETLWRAVSDPTRRRLIELLRDGPRTTGELCRGFSTTRFAVMKHLAVLERSGVVKVSRSGRQRWNALDPEPLRALESRWPRAGEQGSEIGDQGSGIRDRGSGVRDRGAGARGLGSGSVLHPQSRIPDPGPRSLPLSCACSSTPRPGACSTP